MLVRITSKNFDGLGLGSFIGIDNKCTLEMYHTIYFLSERPCVCQDVRIILLSYISERNIRSFPVFSLLNRTIVFYLCKRKGTGNDGWYASFKDIF